MHTNPPDDPERQAHTIFAREVPEIASGDVVIRALARAPGFHTKVVVDSDDPTLDPVGACIGLLGARVARVSEELGGEAIDVSTWSPDADTMIRHALAPLRVATVQLNAFAHRAVVTVPKDQLPTLVGRRAKNRELASQLSGWDIEIVVDPRAI
jgi:N utilization substance protein A